MGSDSSENPGQAADQAFVKVLETDSLTDIALIRTILDASDVRYFIQGENMKFIRPVDPVLLMVAREDVEHVVDLLKDAGLRFVPFVYRSDRRPRQKE